MRWRGSTSKQSCGEGDAGGHGRSRSSCCRQWHSCRAQHSGCHDARCWEGGWWCCWYRRHNHLGRHHNSRSRQQGRPPSQPRCQGSSATCSSRRRRRSNDARADQHGRHGDSRLAATCVASGSSSLDTRGGVLIALSCLDGGQRGRVVLRVWQVCSPHETALDARPVVGQLLAAIVLDVSGPHSACASAVRTGSQTHSTKEHKT